MFLIRHGEHERLGRMLCGRMAGVRLGEAGLRQAAAVARRLGQQAVSAVYASPLERTRETAEPLAATLGVGVILDDDLIELDYGAWTGRSFEALQADPVWQGWNTARLQHRPPQGESMQQAQGRIVRWFERMLARHPQAGVAAVSHGDVIRAGLAHALGLPLERYDRFEISPGSLSVVVGGDWGMKVLSINEVPA
jgi:broad specificity phosphatase PhoE